MNRLARTVSGIWRRPAVTVVLLGAFVLWAAQAAWVGVRDPDATERVRQHIVASDTWSLSLLGVAQRAQLRAERPSASFLGGFEIDYRNGSGTLSMLRLELGIDRLTTSVDCALRDEAGQQLCAWQLGPADDACVVEVPLVRPQGTCSIALSDPLASLRCRAHTLTAGVGSASARAEMGPVLHDVEGVRIRRAPGWIRSGGGDQSGEADVVLVTSGYASLVIEAEAPGPHRLMVEFEKLAPTLPDPRLLLDGQVLPSTLRAPGPGAKVWTLTADCELAPRSVLTLQASAPIRQEVKLRPGRDQVLRAYAVQPQRLRIEPR